MVSGEDLLRILAFGHCRGGVGGFVSIFSRFGFDFRVGFGYWPVFRDTWVDGFKASGLCSLNLRFFVVAWVSCCR